MTDAQSQVPGVDPAMLKESLPKEVDSNAVESLRAKMSKVGPLSASEAKWMDDMCLKRYLRARNSNVDKAYSMLADSIKWRRSFGVEELLLGDLESVKGESTSGKMYAKGHDKAGRGILYMKPRLQNSKDVKAQMQHLVYTLERCVGETVHPQEKVILVLDFKGYTLRNAPSIKTMRETLNILQNHYPERLGVALCIEAPALFSRTYKIIKPFIDPVTREKIQFLERTKDYAPGTKAREMIDKFFDAGQLEKEFGGELPSDYSNDTYFAERFVPEYLA